MKEYIDMCLLFELDRIEIVAQSPSSQASIIQAISNTIATFLICPDGLNEIHIDGKKEVLSELIISIHQDEIIKDNLIE